MPRKKQSKPPVQEAETTTAIAVLEPLPAISEVPREMPAEAQTTSMPEPIPAEATPSFVERLGDRSDRRLTPDPFLIAFDNAAGVRLFENKQRRVMAIKFEERPDQSVVDMVKQEGFGWNPGDRVWTKPARGDSAMATRIDAERLYQEVRQAIRQEKGMDAPQDIPF